MVYLPIEYVGFFLPGLSTDRRESLGPAMKFIERAKRLWRLLDTAVMLFLSLAVAFFGVFATYFFATSPLRTGSPPDPRELVFGLGIVAIGFSGVVGVFLRTKSCFWLCLANVSLWFFLYGVVFDAVRLGQGVSPGLHDIAHSLFTFAMTVVFAILSFRSRRCVRAPSYR